MQDHNTMHQGTIPVTAFLTSPARCGWLAAALCAWWPCIAVAQPTLPPQKVEIQALLTRLESSGCQFNRNGRWYGGADAAHFLGRKLALIDQHGDVASAERFIELAASQSTMSGQPYRVRCGTAPPIESQQWLQSELTSLRHAAALGRR